MNHSEQPTRQNRHLLVLMWVLLLGGVVLFIVSRYMPSFPAPIQLASIGMMVAAVLLVGQYQTRYTYRTEPDIGGGEGYDFVVIRHNGRREQVVCRLGVADVREIEEQTPENRDELKKKYAAQKDTVHSYCVDVLPERSQYIRFDDGGDRVIIRLQASAALLSLFRSAMPDTSKGPEDGQ